MNRHQRRQAARCASAAATLVAKREDFARAAVAADQAGAVGMAQLYREVMRGDVGVAMVGNRTAPVSLAELPPPHRPTVLVIGDDDFCSTGPGGWRCAEIVTRWCRSAVIHAAAATAETYAQAADAARKVGAVLLVETSSKHAEEWVDLVENKHPLVILPRIGAHPVLPTREALN